MTVINHFCFLSLMAQMYAVVDFVLRSFVDYVKLHLALWTDLFFAVTTNPVANAALE